MNDVQIKEMTHSLDQGARDTSGLHRFLNLVLDENEVERLVLGEYQKLLPTITPGASKGEKIELIVQAAEKQGTLLRLVAQVKNRYPQQYAAFSALIALPEVDTVWERPKISMPEVLSLRDILINYFNLEELRTLTFILGVDYDSLGGEGISGKARELIAYMNRRDRIEELVRVIQMERPYMEL